MNTTIIPPQNPVVNVVNSIKSGVEQLQNNANKYISIGQGFGQGVGEMRRSLTDRVSDPIMNRFNNSKLVSGSKEFIESNSMVAKIAFLFLVILVFILVMRIGGWILSIFLGTQSNPVLFSGMKDAATMSIIPQNPSLASSIPILRSVNQDHGIEFSYSFWIFVRDWEVDSNKYKHVFHKGNDKIIFDGARKGRVEPNNAPGVYLHPTENKLVVVMNTFNDITEEVMIHDIPLKKWLHVVIRVSGTNMDTYVNGTIASRHVFNSVPKQNYGDVYINMNGGYNGYFSQLRYYSYGLSIREIQTLMKSGANMSMTDTSMTVKPPYFNIRWYMNQ